MRTTLLLNNDWKFRYGDHRAELCDGWSDIGLPHSFGIPYEMTNDFYVGYGTYTRTLTVPPHWAGKRFLLEFFGVFQRADIIVNGVPAGRHIGGYTCFCVDITDAIVPGKNRLTVLVDNLWQPQVAPRAGEHQFNGGIYRDVYLHVVEPSHLRWQGVTVTTERLGEREATISTSTRIVVRDEELTLRSETFFGDRCVAVCDSPVDTTVGNGVADDVGIRQRLRIENPQLWHFDHPNLYRLCSSLYRGDELVDRQWTTFGIRTIRFDKDGGFFLNGRHERILGANVHQDQGGWADAVTRSSISRDVRMIKDCGMNFIRGSHYPHHPFFVDECDRLGVMYWSELCFWGTGGPNIEGWWTASGYPPHERDQEPFERHCLATLEEMIGQHRNNPSVIAWSVCNEPFFSDDQVMDKARGLARRLVDRVHELDPTRPAAVGGAQRGDFGGIGDVTGYNGDGATLFHDPGFANLVSEYGSRIEDRPGRCDGNFSDGAETDYPWRSGKALWCGFDHGSILGDMGRMGMIDYHRLPKNTWYWYRSWLRGIPVPPAKPKRPAERIRLTADRTTIAGNGQEDAFIHVVLCNADGEPVSDERSVTLHIDGTGIFPTGRSTILCAERRTMLDGEGAVTFRGYYGGVNVITATADGLPSVSVTVTVDAPVCTRAPIAMVPPPRLMSADELRHTATGRSPNDADLARNHPVFSSSYIPGHEPSHVTDATEDWWQPQPESEPWIRVDLEGDTVISVIRIHATGSPITEIGLSLDGERYESVTVHPGDRPGEYQCRGSWRARYIRVTVRPDNRIARLIVI
ncbi:glycoside hydrolase family 2 protein [Bifidobacterium simiiventris]|uniref:glycoside hydrolase family 2 protein n=1 Tax=Bifidobacterium simiiventris TaxID=2834434 RepID=UPI001C55C138|nr:glycoside hydrolase family 2 TIM barrel-domain containing protein [Bifidobacterium simiiventris]MBW3078048.1 hypothetical protein [Bifidobacterium simiiventris]